MESLRYYVDPNAQSSYTPSSGSIHTFTLQKERYTLIVLPECQKLCLLGAANLKMLKGSIEIYGITLAPSPDFIPLFSPRSSSLLTIKYVEGKRELNAMDENLKGILNSLKVGEKDCVLLFQQMQNNFDEFVKVFPQFNNLFEENDEAEKVMPLMDSFSIVIKPLANVTALNILESWKVAVKTIVSQTDCIPVSLVSGNRKVGKSTFSRFLANSLFQKYGKVVLLDLDIGQTEFTPPGVVSLKVLDKPLLGPPFTHLCIPDMSVFVGMSSPSTNPAFFFQACMMLIDYYNSNYRNVYPLVVNTMGWVTGLGFDLLHSTVASIQPNYLLPLAPDNEYPTYIHSIINDHPSLFPVNLNPSYKPTILPVSTQFDGLDISKTKYSPSDLRALSMIFYFSLSFDRNSLCPSFQFLHLTEKLPVQISWNKIAISIPHIYVPKRKIFGSLNGSYVGLAVVEKFEESGKYPKVLSNCPLVKCLGLGIVRGIDFSKMKILIITPLSLSMLDGVNCIIKGNIELPISLTSSVQNSLIFRACCQ